MIETLMNQKLFKYFTLLILLETERPDNTPRLIQYLHLLESFNISLPLP